MVWWLLRKPYGRATAITVLAAVGVGTVGGYFGLGSLLESADHSGVAFFQALVAGSLLHVVIHRVHSEVTEPKGWRIAAGVGGLLGVSFVGLLSVLEPLAGLESHGENSDAIHTFLRLAAESAPALLFAYAAAGLVHVFLPHGSIQWMKKGTTASQAVRGVAFGLPLPMCSCGVIPFYQTLIKRGVPSSAAMAFFVATPELGLDAVFLSIPLLGTSMTLARVLCAFAVALFVGLVVGWWTQTRESSNVEGDESFGASTVHGLWPRTREAIRVGFGDIVDGTGPWIVFGLIVAALADPVLKEYAHLLSNMPDVVEIGAFALLGMPIYVCASGATPLVAVLIANGASPGAAIAFLLTGPATNITTFGVLSALHGRKIAILFGGVIATASIGLGLLVNLWMGGDAGLLSTISFHKHDISAWELFALIALGLVFVLSVLRLGPRRFVGKILPEHDHNHDDDDHCHGEEPEKPSCCAS